MRQFVSAPLLALSLAAAFGAAPPLAAQGGAGATGADAAAVWPVEITPFIGAYLPLTDLFEFSAIGTIPGTVVPARVTLTGKQRSAFAFGGRLSGWFNPRLGAEGTVAYASSEVDVARTIESVATKVNDDRSVGARVWTATARVLYRLARIDRSAVILIGAGPAIISRGGDAYEAPAFDLASTGDVSGTTDIGGVVDLGTRIDASSRIAIRLDAEAYLYSASLSFLDPVFARDLLTSESRFQFDLILSAGLALGL
jgi:hypothetical protein